MRCLNDKERERAGAERNRIKNRFPVLFEECFDFSPPIGWCGVVEKLSEKLSEDPNIRCVQVKSKFGGLRYYLNDAPEWAYDAINLAEKECSALCEMCGNPGTLRNKSWIVTACDKCNNG